MRMDVMYAGRYVCCGSVTAAPSMPDSRLCGGVLADLERLRQRATHDELLVFLLHVLDDLAVGERVTEAFRVWEVGAEHQAVGRQTDVEQSLRVGLVEDVAVDVALEHLERV